MKVTVVGTGHMGSAFAHRLTEAGHDVTLTGRNLDEAKKVAGTTNGKAHVVPPQQAAKDAEVVIAATPFKEQVNALKSLGDLSGKVVVEISNPMKPDMSGLAVGTTTSAAEEVAKSIPGAKVVKAFNTIFAQVLNDAPKFEDGKPATVFYAGDDKEAKDRVAQLAKSMGFEPIDAGPLQNARNLEPMGLQNIWFGYSAKQGTEINPTWVHKDRS